MDMEYGRMRRRYIREDIGWIKKKGLVFINGKISKYIRGNFGRIIDRGMGNFLL